MRPGEALRQAMTSQVSGGGLPSYADLLGRFGSNRGIASAAGTTRGTAADDALMRNLQRYGRAERGEGGEQRGLYGDERAELARRVGWSAEDAERLGLAEVVERMRRDGLVLFRLSGRLRISKDNRHRDIPGGSGGDGVNVHADLLTTPGSELMEDEDYPDATFVDLVAARKWTQAAELFTRAAVVESYGMPGSVEWAEADTLEIGIPE